MLEVLLEMASGQLRLMLMRLVNGDAAQNNCRRLRQRMEREGEEGVKLG